MTIRQPSIQVLPLLLEVLLVAEEVGLGLQGAPLLLLDLLVVLRLEDGVILLRILQGVADQLHPQCLQLYLLDLLLLQPQHQRRLQPSSKVPQTLIQFPHILPHHQLFLQRLMKLQHVEVGHEYEVVHGGLLERLDHEVVHDCEVVEEEGGGLVDEAEGLVELVHAVEGLEDGDECVDDVVQFEDPDEPDLAAPAEDVVIGDFALPAGVVQFLVGGQLHEVVVERDQQFLADEGVQVLRLGLDLVVFELAGPCEHLDLLIEDDIADVELADLAYLDQRHHHLQLTAATPLLLQLLYDRLQEGLLLRLLALLLEQLQRLADALHGQGVAGEPQPLELLEVGVLLEEGVHELHTDIQFLYLTNKVGMGWGWVLDGLFINITEDMQGSRIQTRSNWKQSVKKDNPLQSKIFGENKDLPNKFSPSRLNNLEGGSRSLIKQRTSNYSHDEINLAGILDPQERSISKEGKLQRRDTMKTPKSAKGELQFPAKGAVMSEKSIDFEINRLASKPSNFKSADIDIVRQLKLQFLRFKEKILKELKRQEEQFTNTLKMINQRVSNLQNCTESPIQFKASPSAYKVNTVLSPQLEGYQSPISKYLEALNRMPDSGAQTSSYKNLKIDQILAQDSVTPQIKERMSRMDELLNSLKRDLNQQLPSPPESLPNPSPDI